MQPQNPYGPRSAFRAAPSNAYNTQQPQPPIKKHFNVLIVPLILSVLLIVTSLVFGSWAYQERNTYKFDTENIVKREVDLAVTAAETRKDNEFLEKEKTPLRSYKGPAALGTVSFMYPKTWSAQVSDIGTANPPLSGYLHPDYIPALNDDTAFALRFEVVEKPYSTELKKFDSDIKQGKATVVPYVPKNVTSVTGSRVSGEILSKKQGVMILLPLRDKTLKIWTESNNFVADLDNHVLSTLTFSP